MRKLLFLPILLLTACTGSNKPQEPQAEPETVEQDSNGIDWTETSVPMPVMLCCNYDDNYNIISSQLLQAYCTQEDSLIYTPIADSYHTMLTCSGQQPIRYTGKQEGKEMGYRIEGKYYYCMKGLKYETTSKELSDGFAFNDEFLSNHQLITLQYPNGKAPKNVIDSIEARYDNKVKTSEICGVSSDKGIAIYSVQMKPKDGKCLGMRVISLNDQLSYYEEWCNEYNDESAWHVDDGGEYYPFRPYGVTLGAKGLDIFYYEGAPESSTYSALLQRGDSISSYDFACYYNHVDYAPSLDPVALPANAKLAAELDGYRAWIVTEEEPTEDKLEGRYSVYYSKPNSNEVYKVVTTGENPNAMEKWDNEYQHYIEAADVLTAQEAFIVKHPEWDNYYLIIQGCPDARNVLTYVMSLPVATISDMFRWIRCNEGFQGVDDSGKLLMFDNYAYDEETGRYTTRRYYDFNWSLDHEVRVEE